MTDYSYWVIVNAVEVVPPKAQAYLIIINGQKYWIPASTVTDVRINEHTAEITALEIEFWMIKKKGIEQFIEGD